jgi:hypothetical protein
MFNPISWSQFLSAAACGLIVYYAVIGLLYYREEFRQFFRKKPLPFPAQPSTTQKVPDVMGPARQEKINHPLHPEGTPVADSPAGTEAIRVIPPSSEEEALQLGAVADLLEEIKTLVAALREGNGTREELQSLFEALFARYPQLVGTPYAQSVSEFAQQACRDQFSFPVSLTDLKECWPMP